jgi:mono/diheme cytochrome c family protein
MPVPTETLWNTKRLNKVFAACSVLTLITMLWMLWHDYNRPWRHVQKNYFNLRSAMSHFDAVAYESPKEQEKRKQLAAAVEKAESELANPKAKEREKELLATQQTLAGVLQGVALTYGNQNAELQVKLFEYEEFKTLHGPKDPKTLTKKKIYEDGMTSLAKIKEKQDKLDDQLRDVKSELKALYASKTVAQKALAAYDKGLNDAKRLESMYGPGFKRMAFNFPGLDYLAPSGVPGREEVKQVFSKQVRFNYNFLDSYVTDRCITCHVGIDDPNLTLAAFVKRLEAAMGSEKVMTALRDGNKKLMAELSSRLGDTEIDVPAGADPAAMKKALIGPLVEAANDYLNKIKRPEIVPATVEGSLADAKEVTRGIVTDKVTAAAQEIFAAAPPKSSDGKSLTMQGMTTNEQMRYVASLTAAMNLYLKSEGRPPIDFRNEVKAHPHLDLYVSATSSHPLKTMGCTVCHEGSGQETDFVFAAHTPKNHHEEKEWEEKYYVRELGIPLGTFHLVEEYWERPMLLPGYTSASCRKCHQQTFDLERYRTEPLESAQRVVKGREMFTTVGCINCHAVEGLNDSRRVGPDLAHVGQKLSKGFMERWIEYPNNFRPSTRMPHFFHQENNLASSANDFDHDPVFRTKVEVAAMTHYLQTFSTAYEPLPLPDGLQGNVKRGGELFTSIGCLACHANLDGIDPLDSESRSFGERWITVDLMHKEGLAAEAAKERFTGMSKNDRVRYASQHLTPEAREAATKRAAEEAASADREQRDPDPKKMYIPAAFTRFAPELSGMGTKLIGDPSDSKQVQQGMQWMYNWLSDPRHYSSYTKMPRLFRENVYWSASPEDRTKKTNQDILDVSAYLLSLRNDDFKPEPLPDDARQQEQVQTLVLHLLGGQNTASVSEKILTDTKFAESDPYGRLTSAIVSQTATSFGGGDAGRQKVMAMIQERSPNLADRQKLYLGMKMISHYGCYSCHNIAGFEDATRPGTEVTLWAQKFMSQLDFAFYSPQFTHELEAQPEVFSKLYPESSEFETLVRDSGGNPEHEILYNHPAFAYHKIRNPRIWDRKKIKKPYEKLKMPNFFFSEEEARSLVSYLLSLKDANVDKSVQIAYDTKPAGKIARGRALVHELNCIACHTIEGNEANIQQYYSKDPSLPDTDVRSSRFMPPSLWGEGAKIQFPWLFSFLNNVEMLRPWLNVRMPSFHLTMGETRTLVEYFAGLSQDESGVLTKQIAAVHKYLNEVHADAGGAGNSAAPPWFTDEKFADQAAFLARYGVAKQQIRSIDLNPGGSEDPAEIASTLAPTYDRLAKRGDFLGKTFAVDYPFADPASHTANDAGYKTGEEFFLSLKCLACHVAGDPSVPGTTTEIKAPNFALTHKRLRYDWVVSWLQDPQALMPGTNMPQIFPGTSYTAQLPPDQKAEMEKKIGSTMEEQAKYLVDFLYTLGEQGKTIIQPGGAEPAPADQPAGQATEFDFEAGGATSQPAEKKEDFDF